MRTEFAGFYGPSESEFKLLWRDALIVIDTNVLLGLYRMPKTAREQLIAVLRDLSDRLWIPHHVGLEFHRNRLTVIQRERKVIEAVLEKGASLVVDLRDQVLALQLEKHGLDLQPENLLAEVESATSRLRDAIVRVQDAQVDIGSQDEIRDEIDALFVNRIGEGPKNRQQLDDLIADAEERFKNQVPPGFRDHEKEKAVQDSVFCFDGLIFEKKHGDLIIWRQMMNHCRSNGIKSLVFVTGDNKNDWWWRDCGKTLGPSPQLPREARSAAGIDRFWMYSVGQFVEHAVAYNRADVSAASVEEIREASKGFDLTHFRPTLASMDRHELPSGEYLWRHADPELAASEFDVANSVFDWLQTRFPGSYVGRGYGADFHVVSSDGMVGLDVYHYSTHGRSLISAAFVARLRRGYELVRSGHLSLFELVVVATGDPEQIFRGSNELQSQLHRLESLTSNFAGTAIVVGLVLGARFVQVVRVGDTRSFER